MITIVVSVAATNPSDHFRKRPLISERAFSYCFAFPVAAANAQSGAAPGAASGAVGVHFNSLSHEQLCVERRVQLVQVSNSEKAVTALGGSLLRWAAAHGFKMI